MAKRARKGPIRGLPLTNSAAAPPSPWTVVPLGKPRRRKGPEPGTLDRFGELDRSLYHDLRRLMCEERISVTAAARRLAEEDKVAGIGTPESRARRLAKRYSDDSC
jgi:hypothetical protein